MENGYACKQCNAPASVDAAGVIQRTCSHTCGVTLSLQVVCKGLGSVEEDTGVKKLLAHFRSVGQRFMAKLKRAPKPNNG